MCNHAGCRRHKVVASPGRFPGGDVVEAAKAGDYDRLAVMALAGESTLTYSFGGSGRDAASFDRVGITEGGGWIFFVGGD